MLDYDRPVSVRGFDPNGPLSTSLRTVSAAVAYDHPDTGETLILLVNQAIEVPHMGHNLLSTMQLRLNDVIVNNVPKFLTDKPTEETHSIILKGGEELEDHLIIPLNVDGVTSTFPTRKPTEYEIATCRRFDLTDPDKIYNPHDPFYAQAEEAAVATLLQTGDREQPVRRLASVYKSLATARQVAAAHSQCSAVLLDISPTLNDCTFLTALENAVTVSSVKATTTGSGIDAETLAKNWGIGIHTARRTLKVTTQRGVRSVLHPTLSRRFRTNDRQLRYRRLPIDLFTDTMFSKTLSSRGNKCAQIFTNANGWTRAYPMEKKSQAHEALSLLHQREGVPNVMIMDGAKEQVAGLFRKKCRQAGSHVKQTEPYTPWSNAAEGAIRELKKGVGRKMIRSKAPKRLWDDCLEREAYVRSFIAHDLYSLSGQVPETIVSGETADISPFAISKWYQWVMFRDTFSLKTTWS